MTGQGSTMAPKPLPLKIGEVFQGDLAGLNFTPEPSLVLCDDVLSGSIFSDDEGIAPTASSIDPDVIRFKLQVYCSHDFPR